MSDLFREIYDRQNGDPEAVLADLKLTARQREALSRLIVNECDRIARDGVRLMEQKVGRVGVKADPTGERATLLSECFTPGDGTMVPWGAATVEQHQARIDMLERMRAGLSATIDRHRAAIEAIVAAGVACLNDLDGLDGAA